VIQFFFFFIEFDIYVFFTKVILSYLSRLPVNHSNVTT